MTTPTNFMRAVEPGDLCLIHGYSFTSKWIRFNEALADRRRSPWNHVCVATRWVGSTLMIAEAEPGGAVERPWHYEANLHQWSTGILPACHGAGDAARRYTMAGPWGPRGVPYSYLDYDAILLHDLHLQSAWLQDFIADSSHMICSQLGDQARADAGSHLFADGRWPGYVKPSDIGFLMDAATVK